MPKTKNLNGVPGNLALSFLSTLNYYGDAYAGGWVIRMFDKLNINTLKIDVLKQEIYPKEAMINALLSYLPKLQSIIKTELNIHGFDDNFIVKAELYFERIDKDSLKCIPTMEDINGKIYSAKKPIIEYSYL